MYGGYILGLVAIVAAVALGLKAKTVKGS